MEYLQPKVISVKHGVYQFYEHERCLIFKIQKRVNTAGFFLLEPINLAQLQTAHLPK